MERVRGKAVVFAQVCAQRNLRGRRRSVTRRRNVLVNCNRPLCPVLPMQIATSNAEAQRGMFCGVRQLLLHDLTSGRGEALRTLLNVSVPANGTGA